MSQADGEVAATTLAVLWNGDSVNARLGTGTSGRQRRARRAPARSRSPRSAAPRPELDAALVAHAVFGRLAELLWQGAHADRAEVDHLVDFCLGRGQRSALDSPAINRQYTPAFHRLLTGVQMVGVESRPISRSTVSVSRPAACMRARVRGGRRPTASSRG